MEILLAKHSGFCKGVARAVDAAFEVSPENTYVLGELIHNEEVVARIAERGIRTVENLSEVPDGARLLIRSHGVGKAVYIECEQRNISVVDCTCTFVQRTQKIVEKASREGKTVAIAGHFSHPEVIGLVGWCEGEVYVFDSEEDDFSVLADKEVVLVSQTTFSEQRFSKISENIQKLCLKTVEIFQTICYTTISRQKEALGLSQKCDAVLVVGGKNSSNTRKLCEIASANCDRVYRLSRADDFKYEKIIFCRRVGVIAGASTPDWLIQEVLCKMADNNTEVQKNSEQTEETILPVAEEAAVAEAPAVQQEEAAPAPKKAPAKASAPAEGETMMAKVVADIDREKRYRKGQTLTVKIVSVKDEGLYVSLSGKGELLIEKAELDCETYTKESYTVGQDIVVMVVETAPKVKLSEKAMRKIREEEELLKDVLDGKMFVVKCTGFNKGGLTAELGTYPVFVPAREVRSGYAKDLSSYVGKNLRLKLIEIRKERRKEIIASQRVIIEEERAAQLSARAAKEEAFFSSIEEGQIVEGKVERITNFGAFVSVKGFDCLAHISDLSWTGVKEVSEVLTIGEHYQFVILHIDSEKKKVSLGYKQLQAHPWDLAAGKYAEGDIVHGKVVRITTFGAFVELEKGIDGLVHVSQISYEWLDNPTSVLKIGQEIDAKILAFNPEERKITLSIKALQDRPMPVYEDEEPERQDSRPRQKRGRKNSRQDYEDEAEYREWTDSSYGGVSIGEMLGNDDDNK